jgi:branched-chain amino acid transport system ATP-binding protein
MRREEREVIPLAKEHLTAADWEAIDAAFAGHTDPLLGTDQGAGFEALFRKIVNLAPPPIGVGPTR